MTTHLRPGGIRPPRPNAEKRRLIGATYADAFASFGTKVPPAGRQRSAFEFARPLGTSMAASHWRRVDLQCGWVRSFASTRTGDNGFRLVAASLTNYATTERLNVATGRNATSRVLRRPPINIAMNIRPEVFGPLAPDQQ